MREAEGRRRNNISITVLAELANSLLLLSRSYEAVQAQILQPICPILAQSSLRAKELDPARSSKLEEGAFTEPFEQFSCNLLILLNDCLLHLASHEAEERQEQREHSMWGGHVRFALRASGWQFNCITSWLENPLEFKRKFKPFFK